MLEQTGSHPQLSTLQAWQSPPEVHSEPQWGRTWNKTSSLMSHKSSLPHHLLSRVPPQFQRTFPSFLFFLRRATQGNSPSIVSSPSDAKMKRENRQKQCLYSLRIKAASPVRPHSPFALISGTKVGQDFLSNVYGDVVVLAVVVVDVVDDEVVVALDCFDLSQQTFLSFSLQM